MRIPTPKALFGVPRFTAELSRTDLAPGLPAWQSSACPRGEMADHMDGVDEI
jgi:hypothetical protein